MTARCYNRQCPADLETGPKCTHCGAIAFVPPEFNRPDLVAKARRLFEDKTCHYEPVAILSDT